MNTDKIKEKFNKIGTGIVFSNIERPKRHFAFSQPITNNYTIDVKENRKGETFIINTYSDSRIDIDVLEMKKDIKHLLLMVKDSKKNEIFKENVSKYLCGHDERHWFVATVGNDCKNVEDAMNHLKPAEVELAQKKKNVKRKNRHKRANKGYIRQGEWFFVLVTDFFVKDIYILKNEPIVRGMHSKPHYCEELCREGGEAVYVNNKYAPFGLTTENYKKFIKRNPKAKPPNTIWKLMVRGAGVYARGKVIHPDHRTIILNGWHKIIMNNEGSAVSSSNVFLD